MIPDVTIKNYYLQFIYNAKSDIDKYNKELEVIKNIKQELHKYLENNKTILKESFNINLDNVSEWSSGEYNSKEYIYNVAIKILKTAVDHPNRIIIQQLIKYCNTLRNEHKYNKHIYLASIRKDMKYSTYYKYVSNYYIKVHKCVLQGMGYKFDHGIGTYIINHWKLDPSRMHHKPKLDYSATNARKREIIKQGKKPYDTKEAAWYNARGIPYDGVDYRVFKDSTDWYEFTFIKSSIFKSNNLDYKRTEYVAKKYRGMSYTEMAEQLCNNEEDIYNLQVDIKYKLNILLYKDPTKYINFIRNASQNKYDSGAHNS